MVIAVILEVYDALISPDQFHTLLFSGMAVSSAIGFYLLKNRLKELKLEASR